jgi:hypothetical protein
MTDRFGIVLGTYAKNNPWTAIAIGPFDLAENIKRNLTDHAQCAKLQLKEETKKDDDILSFSK